MSRNFPNGDIVWIDGMFAMSQAKYLVSKREKFLAIIHLDRKAYEKLPIYSQKTKSLTERLSDDEQLKNAAFWYTVTSRPICDQTQCKTFQ